MIIKFREISFDVSRYFPVSIEELLAVESKLGFSFPEDYRTFVTTLGAGETNICIRAFPPRFINDRINETRERFADYWFWTDSPDILTKDRALECLPFFDTDVGDDIIFHPDEPDRWFILPHEATHVAVVSSFRELVDYYCSDCSDELNIDSIFEFDGWSLTEYMNIFDYDSFENLDAGDFLFECENLSDLSLIDDAIDSVIKDSGKKIEVPKCCRAIAAAEMIAALNGNGSDSLPEEVTDWVIGKPKPTPILIDRARQAIDRILADSELKELWKENAEDYPRWIAVLESIKNRV
jgi:Domain of unknown function (DUF4259)/SMI1 / KNR4 family (SUKH-1)